MTITLDTATAQPIALTTLVVHWRAAGFRRLISTTVLVNDQPTEDHIKLTLETRYACHRDSVALVAIERTPA